MLYCLPKSFYDEIKYISENPMFLDKYELTPYKFNDNIQCIEPLSYIIESIKTIKDVMLDSDIFLLRTFGNNNSLYCSTDTEYMSVYFAKIVNNILYITHPSYTEILYKNNEYYMVLHEDFGRIEYSLHDIKCTDDEYILRRWIRCTSIADMFASGNIKAKIPLIILNNLV